MKTSNNNLGGGIVLLCVIALIGFIVSIANKGTKSETSNDTITRFSLSEYDNPEISITVDEHDTLTFYIDPSSIKKKGLRL